MAGKPQKPMHMRRDDRPQRARPSLTATQADRPVPPAPRGISAGARETWKAFWSSPISAAVDTDADMPALRRWAHCMSERERFSALIKKTPLVKGSTGQLRNNPLVDQVAQLNREIHHFEEHFGMTPLARMRLGIAAVDEVTERKRNRVQVDTGQAYADPRDLLKVVS